MPLNRGTINKSLSTLLLEILTKKTPLNNLRQRNWYWYEEGKKHRSFNMAGKAQLGPWFIVRSFITL